jgi:plastocyanin
MKFTRLACLVATAALVACGGGGGDDGGTTGPPPPPPPGNTQTLGSITTNVSSLNLVAGNSQTITVSALDTQNQVISNPGAPSFTSASATVAEVDGSGSVTALHAGTTNIAVSVTMGSVTRTATVAVTVTGLLPSVASVSTTSGDVFTPNKVLIGAGGDVAWTFGTTIHNVTFSQAPGAPARISDTYSTTATRKFNTAGNFSYDCTLHPGMSGTVIVR